MTPVIAPLSYQLSIEVLGLDLRQPISDKDLAAIRTGLLDRGGLILLRGQNLSREQLVTFSRSFGDLDTLDSVPFDRDRQFPEVLLVGNLPRPECVAYGKLIGQVWHSDLASSLLPAGLSFPRAIRVPLVGGHTQFANMYAAFDSLPKGMQKMLRNLNAVYIRGRKRVTDDWEKKNRRPNPPVCQPMVRIHSDTGREALFIG